VSFVVPSFSESEHKPLSNCFWVGSEVGQEPHFVSRRFEVVQDLCPVFGGDFFDGFDFEDHLVETEEIGAEGLDENLAAIGEADFLLGFKRDFAAMELTLQALLINGLQESRSHLPIHLKNGPLNSEAFFTKNKMCSIHMQVFIEPRKTRKARKRCGRSGLSCGFLLFVLFVSFVVRCLDRPCAGLTGGF